VVAWCSFTSPRLPGCFSASWIDLPDETRLIGLTALESTPGAAMLVDVPVGASPAGGACSVATVVMLDNGKSDRPVESSGVKVSVGWGKARSDPPERQADRQAVANSEPGKPRNDSSLGSGRWGKWECRVGSSDDEG